MKPRNKLVPVLLPDDLSRLWSRLEPAAFMRKRVLHSPNKPVQHISLVEDEIVSRNREHGKRELRRRGLARRMRGPAGGPVVVGAGISRDKRVGPVDETALCMSMADRRRAMDERPALRGGLLLYIVSVRVRVGQLAACNMEHAVRQRFALRLLMADDRLGGSTPPLTRSIVSAMLGVRRCVARMRPLPSGAMPRRGISPLPRVKSCASCFGSNGNRHRIVRSRTKRETLFP